MLHYKLNILCHNSLPQLPATALRPTTAVRIPPSCHQRKTKQAEMQNYKTNILNRYTEAKLSGNSYLLMQ